MNFKLIIKLFKIGDLQRQINGFKEYYKSKNGSLLKTR